MTIQIEKEFDVLEKRWDERVYVKLYVAARTSGLLAKISDTDWKTWRASSWISNSRRTSSEGDNLRYQSKVNRIDLLRAGFWAARHYPHMVAQGWPRQVSASTSKYGWDIGTPQPTR